MDRERLFFGVSICMHESESAGPCFLLCEIIKTRGKGNFLLFFTQCHAGKQREREREWCVKEETTCIIIFM